MLVCVSFHFLTPACSSEVPEDDPEQGSSSNSIMEGLSDVQVTLLPLDFLQKGFSDPANKEKFDIVYVSNRYACFLFAFVRDTGATLAPVLT
jgi:hypothetical protein